MRTDNREQRLERLRDRGYRLIFDVGTPRSVARGIGLVLFVAAQREQIQTNVIPGAFAPKG